MALRDFTKDKFDIFIQAGQSNSEGTSFGFTDAPYIPHPKVWYLNPDRTIECAQERVFCNMVQSNFGLSFANAYMYAGLLEEDRNILILRCAVGGTGFGDHRWGMEDDLYLQMMDMIDTAIKLNPENRLKALLWHQGENDAQVKATYEEHYGNLTKLVNSVRQTFGMPDLPFVAGDFVAHWRDEHIEDCKPVLDAIRQVVADGRGAFVSSDGLRSNAQDETNTGLELDNIHFCRKDIYEFGRRYLEAYKSLL